jgi:hypothetical protein
MAPVTWRVVVRYWWPWAWGRLRQACCRHAHLYRVTDAGVRYFRCACGYQVPQLRRTTEERIRLRALLQGTARAARPGGGGSAPRTNRL